jgi:ABC-type phosphate transport system ATPase subunit
MSTVQEIEAVIPRLTRAQIEELRDWIEDYLESQLELTDEVKAKLGQSRQEVAGGQFTRKPESAAVAAALQIWSATFSRAFDRLPLCSRAGAAQG